jgi:hypothetical protein
MPRYTFGAIAAGFVSLAVGATSAQAGSLALGGGWEASWDSSLDADLSLAVDFVGHDAVFIEKHLQFNNNGAVDIKFTQTGPGAKFIVLDDEQVINNTGGSWASFKISLDNAAFDTVKTDVKPPGSGFDISPFTSGVFSDADHTLTVSGATIPSRPAAGNTWFPGTGANSGLWVIDGALSGVNGHLASFTLTEQPGPGGHVIPVPAAAWTGLSGLIGLAGLSLRKSVRRLFA